jgi:hypothetical protein
MDALTPEFKQFLPRVRMLPAEMLAVHWVASRMREVDRREVFAGRLTSPEALTIDVMTVPGFVDIAWRDVTPCAVVGGREAWPGVWNVWCWGTDDWFSVKLTVTRHIIRTLIPAIVKSGGWRGQCYSHEDHHEAHAWLKWLGFECEGTMREFGRDGSDFFMFGWRVSRNMHGRYADYAEVFNQAHSDGRPT